MTVPQRGKAPVVAPPEDAIPPDVTPKKSTKKPSAEIRDDQLPGPDFTAWEASRPAEWADREIMATIWRTLSEVKGYEAHVGKVKREYELALEEEKRKAGGGNEQR